MMELLDQMNTSISAQEQRDARALPDNERNDFEAWLHRVDRLLIRFCMMDSTDLPHWSWHNSFDKNCTPQQAINIFFEEYGDEYQELATDLD